VLGRSADSAAVVEYAARGDQPALATPLSRTFVSRLVFVATPQGEGFFTDAIRSAMENDAERREKNEKHTEEALARAQAKQKNWTYASHFGPMRYVCHVFPRHA